ncbi:MAG: hypothetical protein RI897_4320 [Verrucomicrobiota bacterium]
MLVGVGGGAAIAPEEVAGAALVSFEDHGDGLAFAEDGGALGALDDISEELVAIAHMAALGGHAGAIREGVFGEVVVEEFIGVGTDLASAHALDGGWPVVFDPTADVDVMDQPIDDEAAVEPGIAAIVGDLVGEFGCIGVTWADADGAVHAIGPGSDDIADDAFVDLLDRLFEGDGVAAHEAGGDLEVFGGGEFAGFEDPAYAWGVDCERFFHEDMDAFFDGVFEVQGAEGGRGGEEDDVILI